jgi:1-acyl-sn-glycerol-3-phosphate acyltransferase
MEQRPGWRARANLTWLRILKGIGRVVCRSYLRVYCEGVDNIPDEGACLVVSNHVSGLDPFLIGAMIDRPIHYVAKTEIYKTPIITWILNSLGTVPIDRSVLDVSAARQVLQLLRAGELVGIAPEGTRSRTGKTLPFTHGATKLALHTRTPLVPAAIHGTYELMPPGAKYFRPGRVYIKFGKLFDLSESYNEPRTSELVGENTAIIRRKIVELLEQTRTRPLK